ncbi:MAG: hypothetical protein K2H43_03865, partial [Clostridia bacterium]|nr:hypothetical protein [Clostridia bacterium]
SDSIVYGIMRNFTGPTGFTLEEILLGFSEEESDALGINFLLVDIVNQYRLRLKNYSDSCEIDFRLTDDPSNSEEDRENFCRDLLRATGDDRDKIKSAYKKVIDLFPDRLHGSLCLIVKRDYALPDDMIRDGVFLEQPVEIGKVLAELNDDKHGVDGVVSAHAKYHALTGLFLEMLNIDGITVADDAGRLRAFNVFVKSDVDGEESVAGGARKRAAEFLCKQTNENYVGVYFQSQDGTCFYRRIGDE